MPTLNDVLSGSLAQAVQVQQIIDAMKGTASKGVPVSYTSLNDPSNYALTVRNLDPTNSRALSVLKSDGTNLITADVTGVTLGGPLGLPAGSVTTAMLAANAATVPQAGTPYFATPSFSTTSVSVWTATPIQVVATTTGGFVRINGYLTWAHTVAAGAADWGLFMDGTQQNTLARQHDPLAGGNVQMSFEFVMAPSAATHTFTVEVFNLVAGTLSIGSVNAYMNVSEYKR